MLTTVTVSLDTFSYPIQIGAGLLDDLGSACRQAGLGGTAAVISNTTVAPLYAEKVLLSLRAAAFSAVLITVADGEEFKNSDTLNWVYDQLIASGIDRRSCIVALGGGVVGDLAGFAAATYLRGIPFVQVPTTLLAQVDSSVGGKTGIDHPLGKNLIGAFYQPQLVVADLDTLKTLPERHYRAGLAEVVKYGAVLDASLFTLLENSVEQLLAQEPQLLNRVIARCCEIKAQVVAQDEKESGLRAVLNYGHTVGHAYETLGGYQELVHGEAVAIGMAWAATFSEQEGYCSAADRQRIIALLERFGLPVAAPPAAADMLLAALAKDKKSSAGTLQYVCNRGIGRHAFHQYTPAFLAEACCTGR